MNVLKRDVRPALPGERPALAGLGDDIEFDANRRR